MMIFMDDFKIDPTNYTMKGNAPRNDIVPAFELSESQLATLESMPHAELIALVRRVSGATGALQAALMTKEEVAEAMKIKLAAQGLNERDMYKALPIMKEWFDREQGKATQRIEQKITKTTLAANLTNDQLMHQVSHLLKANQLPPGISQAADGSLVIDADYTPLD